MSRYAEEKRFAVTDAFSTDERKHIQKQCVYLWLSQSNAMGNQMLWKLKSNESILLIQTKLKINLKVKKKILESSLNVHFPK